MFLSRIISRLMDWSNVACKHCHYSGSLEPISCFHIASMISRFSRAKTKSFLLTFLASVTEGLISRKCFLPKSSVTSSFGYIQYVFPWSSFALVFRVESAWTETLSTCWCYDCMDARFQPFSCNVITNSSSSNGQMKSPKGSS